MLIRKTRVEGCEGRLNSYAIKRVLRCWANGSSRDLNMPRRSERDDGGNADDGFEDPGVETLAHWWIGTPAPRETRSRSRRPAEDWVREVGAHRTATRTKRVIEPPPRAIVVFAILVAVLTLALAGVFSGSHHHRKLPVASAPVTQLPTSSPTAIQRQNRLTPPLPPLKPRDPGGGAK